MSDIKSRPTLLPVKKIAKMYHMSERTIYDHIKQDPDFPSVNVGLKKKYLINEDELQVWILRRTQREKRKIINNVPSLEELTGVRYGSI